MFTGIVQAVGRITNSTPHGDGYRITVDARALEPTDIAVGDSVAISGCCLTVIEIGGTMLRFDVSAETLRSTTGLNNSGAVNLELAMRLSDRLGGHLMSGHVDGVGTVVAFGAVANDAYGSWQLSIDAPSDLARFIASKGSIAVDGVSLTVNAVDATRFTANLIPHTLAVTTLKALVPAAKVNLEIDLIARYVARFLESS